MFDWLFMLFAPPMVKAQDEGETKLDARGQLPISQTVRNIEMMKARRMRKSRIMLAVLAGILIFLCVGCWRAQALWKASKAQPATAVAPAVAPVAATVASSEDRKSVV